MGKWRSFFFGVKFRS